MIVLGIKLPLTRFLVKYMTFKQGEVLFFYHRTVALVWFSHPTPKESLIIELPILHIFSNGPILKGGFAHVDATWWVGPPISTSLSFFSHISPLSVFSLHYPALLAVPRPSLTSDAGCTCLVPVARLCRPLGVCALRRPSITHASS